MFEKRVVSRCISSDCCMGWNDAVEAANAKDREWELFDHITTAWFKMQCYFRRENGMVYSSISGRRMPFDKAINEFIAHLVD